MKNLLLFICALIVCFLLGEGTIRIIQPQQLVIVRPDIWQPDDGFGWRHQINLNTLVNTGEGQVRLRTDEEGHRINIKDPEVGRKYNRRILVLGDSFMEALAIENKETVFELVKSRIMNRFHDYVKVDNTGVAGWNPNHYLLQAKRSLFYHQYDLGIVFLYVGNDVVFSKSNSFPPKSPAAKPWRIPLSLEWREVVDSVLYPFNEAMERNSHLYVFWKNSSQKLLAKMGFTAYYFPDVLLISEEGKERWKITADICQQIQEEFEKFSTPVFFVLLPSHIQVHSEALKRYVEYFDIDRDRVDLQQPSRLLSAQLMKANLKYVDVLPFLLQKAQSGEKLYGTTDTHMNRLGHRALTEAIAPIVLKYLNYSS